MIYQSLRYPYNYNSLARFGYVPEYSITECIDLSFIPYDLLQTLEIGKSSLIKFITSNTGVSCMANN